LTLASVTSALVIGNLRNAICPSPQSLPWTLSDSVQSFSTKCSILARHREVSFLWRNGTERIEQPELLCVKDSVGQPSHWAADQPQGCWRPGFCSSREESWGLDPQKMTFHCQVLLIHSLPVHTYQVVDCCSMQFFST
jgi:hypothetical protein